MKKLGIIALGWLGEQIYHHFKENYICLGTYASNKKEVENQILFNINKDTLPLELSSCDILILNLPPSKIEDLNKFAEIISGLKGKRVILVSSTVVYEGHERANEDTLIQAKSERALKQKRIEDIITKSCPDHFILRCAGLYGVGRHPGRYLAGREGIPNGQAAVNLISGNDILGLLERNLEKSEIRVLNAVNSHHPSKQSYYQDYCKRNNSSMPLFKDELLENRIVETKYDEFKISSELP